MQEMALHAVVGLQTGDEGKGVWIDRIIDDPSILGLEERVFAVVKSNGGDNAGHTITLDAADALGRTLVCKLYDSGVKYKDMQHIFGSYVVCNLLSLKWELEEIRTRLGHDPLATSRFSDKMSLILPYHRIRDVASEQFRAMRFGSPTGTTARGIGPAYVDIAGRDGLRASALSDKDEFAQGVTYHCENTVAIVRHVFAQTYPDFRSLFHLISEKDERRVAPLRKIGLGFDSDFARFMDKRRFCFNVERIIDEYWQVGEEIADHIEDIGQYCMHELRLGHEFLGEVSQGFLLDVIEGLPPNTTSSQTTSGVVALSMGVAPQHLKSVLGVAKAYETKVGTHVFPEEFTPDHYPRLYEKLKVHEFGSVTGRQRMVGALSMPTLRRAVRANGATHLVINKVDLLAGTKDIPVTVAYGERDSARSTHLTPSSNRSLSTMVPIIKTYAGFAGDLRGCQNRNDLPPAAKDLCAAIERDLSKHSLHLRLLGVGIGPDRGDYVLW